MGYAANDAYAGRAQMPAGGEVIIEYFDAARVLEVFGPQRKLVANRKRIGWYWRPMLGVPAWHGAYTSSQQACKAAIEASQPKRRKGARQ